ncbi:hypothetical protein [Mesorhizobium sp. M1163]|uniref:hypothetical protein n=1 Tax=Mesorhizobium sp. M1163 TaxID=2957065 RepID=UPI003336407D
MLNQTMGKSKMTSMPLGHLDATLNGPMTKAEEFVCWSRMQAEAGQPLEAIIERKELERRAGGGMFFWGVGNAPAAVANALARLGRPVAAVFSIMKGKPKAVDVNPGRTVAWRRYFDADGTVRILPPHVLVTSRGDSPKGPKEKHFALMCWSGKPLEIQTGIPFDPSAYRNAGGTGAPVGASQVTALLKRTSTPSSETSYEANLCAWLVGGYWVRLTDPIELTPQATRLISDGPSPGEGWIDFVGRLRQSAGEARREVVPNGYLI